MTESITSGQNVVGAILGDGWYRGNNADWGRNIYGNKLSFLCFLEIKYVDGSTQNVLSDRGWKVLPSPILRNDLQLGVVYDARKEIKNWSTPSGEDRKWSQAEIADHYNGKIVAQIGPTIQKTQIISAKNRSEPVKGVYIFDMGQNMVGWARLKVRGKPGIKVKLRFGEMIEKDRKLFTANLRKATQTDVCILKGVDTEVFEPRFTYHGFRYVEVTGFPGIPDLESLTGCVMGSATANNGTFESSNAMVNKLYNNIKWGQRGEFYQYSYRLSTKG